MEKAELRKLQLDRCKTLTPLMACFVTELLQANGKKRIYFLQWLKLLLDDYSRKNLPELNKTYKNTRDQLLLLKKKHAKDSEIKQLVKTLKSKNIELIRASFGLEHLLREMCQIYESCMHFGKHTVPKVLLSQAQCLPQIMAEIMGEGHALELMDGDASHVPISWVVAVIEKLKVVCSKHGRNKNGGKVFVLSILGIQSSGKSTLLNKMFGLHFNVSAGRCTRGAYIQLLPLNDSLRKMIDCDYMLIVDTEGLRAPELQLGGVKHDNELATFVIGLADATIINIFGEAPGDLDDILQTSLHAFIRMRKVEMKPSCLFVHQNVPGVLAGSKSMLGRQQFQDKLDKMTNAAAKVENCEGQFIVFSHVIKFDDSQDVFYFPSLWKGDPPMAPVNTGYSENAQKLKTALINLTQRQDTCRCSLETFNLRVKSLWGAVLQENFVFSFKNTLEVCAYNELDSECAQWSWTIQSKMLEWENTTKWEINGCDSQMKSKIKQVAEKCYEEATKTIYTTYMESLGKLEAFLDTSEHSQTLLQWKHRTETRLRELYNEIEKQAKKFCDDLVANKLIHVELDKLEKGHIAQIQKHIRELVDQSWKSGKQYTEKEIQQKFEAKWTEWMNDFKTEKAQTIEYPSNREIEANIGEILRELLQVGDSKIIEELLKKPLSERCLSLTLIVDKKAHLSSTKWYGYKPISHDDVVKATKLTEEYLFKAREYLDKIEKDSEPFNGGALVYKLLLDLITCIDDLTKKESNSSFTFTYTYKVEMALVECAYALNVFKKTVRKIETENNPITKLNNLKSTFFTNFKDEYNRVNNETKAANSLCGLLSTSIEEALQATLERMIVDTIQKDEHRLSSKAGFKIQILQELANNSRNFSRTELFYHYKGYLTDMRGCFRFWAKYYVEKYCNSIVGEGSSRTHKITHFALETLANITDMIASTVNDLCKPVYTICDIQSWLNEFTHILKGKIPLQRSTMDKFVGDCNVSKFSEYVIAGIQKIKDTLKGKYSNRSWLIEQMSSRSKSPDILLYERLIGCTAMCPFCGEQCERTSTCPTDHAIKLHRYLSLGTSRYRETNQLVLRTCTDYVGTKKESFIKADGSLHPFCRYKEVYTDWVINPCTTEPAYWKWFVCNFDSEIQDWVEATPTTVPKEWYKISLQEAIDSLPHIIYSN